MSPGLVAQIAACCRRVLDVCSWRVRQAVLLSSCTSFRVLPVALHPVPLPLYRVALSLLPVLIALVILRTNTAGSFRRYWCTRNRSDPCGKVLASELAGAQSSQVLFQGQKSSLCSLPLPHWESPIPASGSTKNQTSARSNAVPPPHFVLVSPPAPALHFSCSGSVNPLLALFFSVSPNLGPNTASVSLSPWTRSMNRPIETT